MIIIPEDSIISEEEYFVENEESENENDTDTLDPNSEEEIIVAEIDAVAESSSPVVQGRPRRANAERGVVFELQVSTAQDPSSDLKIKSKHCGTTIGLNGKANYHHLTGLIRKL